MDVLWSYRCDFEHVWVRAETEPGVDPDAGGCPEAGHPAVTACREPWADRVGFVLTPAARIVDAVRGTVIGEGHYFVTLVSRDGIELAVSTRELTLPEAQARISELSRADQVGVLRRAARMGFTMRSVGPTS